MKPWTQKEPAGVVIVMRGQPMSDDEITRALKGNETAPWCKALLQLYDETRADYALGAANAAARNNALDMARLNGAAQAMVELLADLEKRVKGD